MVPKFTIIVYNEAKTQPNNGKIIKKHIDAHEKEEVLMKALAKLAVKILALYFISLGILNSIGFITTIIIQFDTVSKDLSIISIIISPVCYLVLGILLWSISNFISKVIIGKSEAVPEEISLNISFELLLRSLIIIVGIVVITIAIPEILSGIYVYVSLNEFDTSTLLLKQKAAIIENIIKVIIGIFLVFGVKGISEIIQKLGHLGIYDSTVSDSNKDD
jgi:hypothetical protein